MITVVAAEPVEELTIDELARATGMTVRNIRAHQSRGLLPPPTVRARTGYYGPDHVGRLRLIQDMQADGFNLRAIERLLDRAGGAGEEALAFEREALAPFGDEQPEVAELDELEARLHGPFDPRTLRKAERLGLIRSLGEGRYEIPSPTLLRGAEQLVELGVPLSHVLAVGEQITRHSRAVAEAFVKMFVQDVLGRVQGEARQSPEEWARVRDALDTLRPLAGQALLAAFQQTMTAAVERESHRRLGR